MLKEKDKPTLIQIVNHAYDDENFKKELISSPKKVLEDHGIYLEDIKEVHIYENTRNNFHLVVPLKSKKVVEAPSKLKIHPNLSQIAKWISSQIQNDGPYKEALLENPIKVLRDEKIDIPQKLQVHIHLNTPDEVNFVIPRKIENGEELTDLDLEAISGGKFKATLGPHGKVETQVTNFNFKDDLFNFGNNYGSLEE